MPTNAALGFSPVSNEAMDRALPAGVREAMDTAPFWFDATTGNLRCSACEQSVLRTHEHGRSLEGRFLTEMHDASQPAAYSLTGVRSAVYAHMLQAHRAQVWPAPAAEAAR